MKKVGFNDEYFDQGINRMGTRCEKWDGIREGAGDPEMMPFWVADMDFPSPPAVTQALLARAAHPAYGYTEPEEDDYTAAADFWRRHHRPQARHSYLHEARRRRRGHVAGVRSVSVLRAGHGTYHRHGAACLGG